MRPMARRDEGIRSYGPGKFYTVLDSYVYELTLDGGANEEESYPEGGGWYGLVWMDEQAVGQVIKIAREHRQEDGPLTDEEIDLLGRVEAIILFERSDGIVEADWYDDGRDAQKAWDAIVAEFDAQYEEE